MGLRDAIGTLRYLGAGNVLHWLWHRVQLRTGHFRRVLPARAWEGISLREILAPGVPADQAGYAAYRRTHAGPFFFRPGKLPHRCDEMLGLDADAIARTVRVADDYYAGRFLYFGHETGDLTACGTAAPGCASGTGTPEGGCPTSTSGINWQLNPFTGATAPPKVHWSEGSNFIAGLGDVKFIWEPSRFAAAYWLVRAAWLTGDAKYGLRFWVLVESWAQANPPQLGVNWQSGQEVALRAMAICFGAYAFANHPAATPDRLALLLRMMSEHGRRIEAYIGHAIRQKTNHSITEATGLWTIGLLFPELRDAERWAGLGRRILERELARQLYDDGSYVQHSMNYHRLMIQTCCWAWRLGQVAEQPLSDAFRDRIGKAGEFLFQMLDVPSGRVPNYGANDGALVLPLDSCEYLDYRPTIQLASYIAGWRLLPSGPWDEPLIWLAGADMVEQTDGAGRRPASTRFDAGGYYTLRDARTDDWAMVRCHSYRDRVGHVDMLHLDLWHRGQNVLRDGGSYGYYLPNDPEAERHFLSVEAHNTVQIDGAEPLRRVSRFLWAPWPRARVIEFSPDGAAATVFEGEHYGYDRQPWRCVVRRRVELLSTGRWRITDTISGSGRHAVAVRWRLIDRPFELDGSAGVLRMQLPGGAMTVTMRAENAESPVRLEVVRGRSSPPAGWESLYYGHRQSAPVLVAATSGTLPMSVRTDITLTTHDGTGATP